MTRYQVIRIFLSQWRRYKPLLLSRHGDCKHSRYVRQLAYEPLLWLSQNWHAWFNVKYTRCLARTPHSWSCPGENPRLSSPSMLRAVFQVKMLFFFMVHLFQYRITSFCVPFPSSDSCNTNRLCVSYRGVISFYAVRVMWPRRCTNKSYNVFVLLYTGK